MKPRRPRLKNILDKETALAQVAAEPFARRTVSFYRYVKIADPNALRDQLYIAWSALGVLGRVYVAHEGINAQICVPEPTWDFFVRHLERNKYFEKMPLKIAIEEPRISFWKLTIKVKHKIVADGIDDERFNPGNVGTHLDAQSWNELMDDPDAVVVDMRNFYESEVGRFDGAITPDVDTFAQELQVVPELLADKKDKKIMMYCTGGIRCEKASAYMKYRGFEHVYQLHGGIIHYMQEVRSRGLEPRFKGKNFVFDGRMGERATDDVLSQCHQCGEDCDDHTNCRNDACHLLFIQCAECAKKYEECCSQACRDIVRLPREEQLLLRKGNKRAGDQKAVYQSRLRPRLVGQ